MIIAIVVTVIVVLVLAVIVAVARDPGPGPRDVAVSYELAWDSLDFDALYVLSGAELRDGLDRPAFVDAKRVAYEHQRALRNLVTSVGIEDSAATQDAAVVVTRVESHDGSVVHNRVDLARRQGRWQVTAYQLAPEEDGAPHA